LVLIVIHKIRDVKTGGRIRDSSEYQNFTFFADVAMHFCLCDGDFFSAISAKSQQRMGKLWGKKVHLFFYFIYIIFIRHTLRKNNFSVLQNFKSCVITPSAQPSNCLYDVFNTMWAHYTVIIFTFGVNPVIYLIFQKTIPHVLKNIYTIELTFIW
jgi:hypothetical protein